MPFVKYSEIENYYRQKFINEHLEYNPSCARAQYIYQIKYDGSNIQLIFTPDGRMSVGKRSSLISPDENFNDIWNVLHRYQEDDLYAEIFENLSVYSKYHNVTINLYGEIFGQGIQKRINYGLEKYLIFFDIRVDGKMLTYQEAYDMFPSLVENFYAQTHGPVPFEDILNLQVPEGHEGIVIKQYNRVNENDRLLALKKKSSEFEEKMKPKKKKEKKPEDPEVTKLKEEFLPYINKNRVLSVFSKEGEIEKPSQIGEYIRLVMEDAINDFKKDVDISGVDKKQLNMVYKSGNRAAVKILNEYL